MTHDIVAKLWNLCNVLKDDGVTYHQYVTELTYILFLKMAGETGTEDQIPKGHRWADLIAKSAPERLEFYKLTLIHLGSHGSKLVQEIFAVRVVPGIRFPDLVNHDTKLLDGSFILPDADLQRMPDEYRMTLASGMP